MAPKTNPNKITSLGAWTDAFIVFARLSFTRHPTDIKGILKYIKTIRLGASRNPKASPLEFDKQFLLKMSADSTISWAFVDAELGFIYLSNQFLTQQNQSNLKWHDCNFKGSCSRQHFLYLHSCIVTKATPPPKKKALLVIAVITISQYHAYMNLVLDRHRYGLTGISFVSVYKKGKSVTLPQIL